MDAGKSAAAAPAEKGRNPKQTGEQNSAPSVALARAVARHLEGRPEEALKELERAVAKGERTAEIFQAMGQVQFELGRYEDSAASFRELLKLDPGNADAWFNVAVCLERLERWQEAAEHYKK
ncbi:MAG: tetratricopeptide repeat protein, partial [Bryobacteraceae bacterium]